MKLGTRWSFGDAPPASIPDSLRHGILHVETAIVADGFGQPRPRWTLTWLEGSPIAELDTGVIVSLGADGEPVTHYDDDALD